MRSPARSLPYGTMAGIMTLLIAATLTWYVCSGLIPWEYLGQAGTPLFDAARVTGSTSLMVLLFIGTIFSTLASANGCINDASRAWFSMGRDRYLPVWFGAVHPSYRTPYRSIVFLVPIALIFALGAPLDQVITFSILSGLLGYTFMTFNMIMFRRKWPLGIDQARLCPPVPPAAGIACCWCSARATYFAVFLGYGTQLDRDDVLLHRGLALVPLLALPLRAARRPVHHALAQAGRLLTDLRRRRPGGAIIARPFVMSTGIIALLALAVLGARVARPQGAGATIAMRWRAGLACSTPLAPAPRSAEIAIGPDGFPLAVGALADGRRMRARAHCRQPRPPPACRSSGSTLTIFDSGSRRGYSIGALARPTGAEFYSLVHELPEVLAPPPGEVPLDRAWALRPATDVASGGRGPDCPIRRSGAEGGGAHPARRPHRASRLRGRPRRACHLAPGPLRHEPRGLVGAVESALADAAALERAFAPLAPAARVLA